MPPKVIVYSFPSAARPPQIGRPSVPLGQHRSHS